MALVVSLEPSFVQQQAEKKFGDFYETRQHVLSQVSSSNCSYILH